MSRIMHGSTKTYTHSTGLSCCFRQWKASSHCNKLHGYALQVEVKFEAVSLDERNWVVDFGGLKAFKEWLQAQFDHTTIVALDDPEISIFRTMNQMGIIDLRVADNVGCEAFSELIFRWLSQWLVTQPDYVGRVVVKEVVVREHDGNSGYSRILGDGRG